MKRRIQFLLMIALVLLANGAAFPFGGENPLGPGENIGNAAERKNWHHQDIAYDALIAAGFQKGATLSAPGAAESITWPADYIDSYLYNPLFWIPGGISRFKVSLATSPELVKLHFDDSFSLPAVQAAWRKYLTGTVAGLQWAKERNDVVSAHNIIGVSLHSIADFYAHSNWIDDPARRDKTWFDLTTNQRSTLPLFTGVYEEPEQLGIKHHGKIMPICTLIKGGLVEQVLDVGCRGISPFTKSTVCDHHRDCKRATGVNPPASVAGINLPQGLVYALPGIGIDSTWQAPIAYQMRGIKDSDPITVFNAAKTVAKRASTQWLQTLEYQMGKMGNAAFWQQCKTASTFSQRHVPYENYAKFPYTFLSAGPYPLNPTGGSRSLPTAQRVVPFSVGGSRAAAMETADRPIDGIRAINLQNNEGAGTIEVKDQPLQPRPFPIKGPIKFMPIIKTPITRPPVLIPVNPTVPVITAKDDYYLRVKLKTSTESFSGTDSDIILHAAGKQFLLDYMPRENPLIAYNDLEAGDEQVYIVGPFDSVPTSIMLENRSASAGEVLEAFGKAFVDAIKTVVEAIGDFFMSLVGGHADHVGQGGIVWEPNQLAGIGTSPVAFSKYVNGGDEGKYTVHGTIRKVGENTNGHPSQHYADYHVQLNTLQCHNESKIDRLSSSDEPFIFGILVPHPGSTQRFMRGPFSDVDSGESRGMNVSFGFVRIPKAFGRLSVQFQIWESDDESSSSRNELLNKFATKADTAVDPSERGLLDTIGAALAADWKLQHIEVYAFGRGNKAHAGTVLDQTVNAWIEGKKTRSFNLNTSACRDLGVTAEELQAGSVPGGVQIKPFPGGTTIQKIPLNPAPKRNEASLHHILPLVGITGVLVGLGAIGMGRRQR